MRAKVSKAFKVASRPLRQVVFSASFALLSVWFVASSVASIHFHEQIAPLWSDAAQTVSAKSLDFTRGLSRFNALLR